MKRCPITYKPCSGKYSAEGLHLLSPNLETLADFPYKPPEQLELLLGYSNQFSFSGVQPKLNAKLDVSQGAFVPVSRGGAFILKLPRTDLPHLPENEDLTMRLGAAAGLDVPLHGLVHAGKQQFVYFIKRFDQRALKQKLGVEDFGQLAGLDKESKYDFSMEKAAAVIEQFCTFPLVDKEKLWHLTLFSFLVGNEDMHAKNFSVVREGDTIKLSPAYDLVCSTIEIQTREELALPLHGKKSNLQRKDFVDYFGKERLKLPDHSISAILQRLEVSIPQWRELIGISFLAEEKKERYLALIEKRAARIF